MSPFRFCMRAALACAAAHLLNLALHGNVDGLSAATFFSLLGQLVEPEDPSLRAR
jgi:hypothetical protein